MKYARGFLMAWGNFTAIPCPYGKWHESSRSGMLCMLPLVGTCLGVITAAVMALLEYISAPPLLTGAVVTAAYFLCTGFIHLDGFMDCSDAVMSRRPELEERQRILKDPSAGAFAVISVVIMLMVFAACMVTLAAEFSAAAAFLPPVIFTVSRGVASGAVIRHPAMGKSQYADLGAKGGRFQAAELAALAVACLLPVFACCVISVLLTGDMRLLMLLLMPALAAAAAAAVTGRNDRKQLGGMNGDIGGHMIVMGEAAGMLAAALLVCII